MKCPVLFSDWVRQSMSWWRDSLSTCSGDCAWFWCDFCVCRQWLLSKTCSPFSILHCLLVCWLLSWAFSSNITSTFWPLFFFTNFEMLGKGLSNSNSVFCWSLGGFSGCVLKFLSLAMWSYYTSILQKFFDNINYSFEDRYEVKWL